MIPLRVMRIREAGYRFIGLDNDQGKVRRSVTHLLSKATATGRHDLVGNPGFLPENMRKDLDRIGEIAKSFIVIGVIALAAFFAQVRKELERVPQLAGASDAFEGFNHCSLNIVDACEAGYLFRCPQTRKIAYFIEIPSPYEPAKPVHLLVDSENGSFEVRIGIGMAILCGLGMTRPREAMLS